jgi:hypothetical protein
MVSIGPAADNSAIDNSAIEDKTSHDSLPSPA